MSKVIGWKLASEAPAGGIKVGGAAMEFSALEESVFSKLAADYAQLVESSELPMVSDLPAFERLVKQLCSVYGVKLGKPAQQKLACAAYHTFSGKGPLDFLLAGNDFEEISFVGTAEPVYVFSRKNSAWLATNCYICSDKYATNLVNRIASKSGLRMSYATPRLDARLDGGERLHAACPPVSPSGVSFSIRLFPQSKLDLSCLIARSAIDAKAAAFLWFAMQSDCSIIVAGNTGGGKTTLLNAMADLVGLDERIVIVEDTPELSLAQKHVARLVANKTPMSDLVKDTLRMRPDRVFVGEVRAAADSRALFDCLLSGQAKGTYATFHSDSASECLSRLRLLGAGEHELSALDLIVVARRIPVYDIATRHGTELRRVTEICEVAFRGAEAYARPLFLYDPQSDRMRFLGLGEGPLKKKFFSCLRGATKVGFEKEWARREEFLAASNGGSLASLADGYLYPEKLRT